MVLTDARWWVLEPLIEACRSHRETQRRDLRRTMEAIIWRRQNGAKWRAVPTEYGTSVLGLPFRRLGRLEIARERGRLAPALGRFARGALGSRLSRRRHRLLKGDDRRSAAGCREPAALERRERLLRDLTRRLRSAHQVDDPARRRGQALGGRRVRFAIRHRSGVGLSSSRLRGARASRRARRAAASASDRRTGRSTRGSAAAR